MNIAIYLGHNPGESVDARHPEKGNPGVGGTQYVMLLLAHYLLKDPRYKVSVLASRDYILGGGNFCAYREIPKLSVPVSGSGQTF